MKKISELVLGITNRPPIWPVCQKVIHMAQLSDVSA